MSSINSSDSSNRNDEVVRRNREEYKQKESELVKKHQREIRRLNEAHYGEVENLKENQQSTLGEYQSKSKENLSRRDMKYQKEIENLRALHRKQMTDLSNDAQTRVVTSANASEGGIEMMKNQFQEKSADMTQSHRNEITEKEKAYYQSIEDMRAEQKKAIEGTRQKMNERHTDEMKAVTEGTSTEKAELSRAYRNYRQSAESRLKQQEIQHMSDKQRTSDNFMGTIKNERMTQEDSKQNLREGFKESLEDIDNKYSKHRQEDLKYSALSQESLRSGVNERVNGKMRSLENEVRDLEAQNVRSDVNREQRKAREIKNARDAFQANVDVYKGQKEQLLQQMNEGNAKDIAEVHEETSQLMQNNSRQYLGRMETQNAKNKEAVTTMKSDFTARQDQSSKQADARVKNVIEVVGNEKARTVKNFEGKFDMLRQQQADEVKELQLNHMMSSVEISEKLKEQMRNREAGHQDKLHQVKNKYEKQISELNDKRTLEKRSADETLKRQAEELKRAHHMELEAQQMQFRDKIAKVEQLHDGEMKTVTERHNEQVDQLVGAMRKT